MTHRVLFVFAVVGAGAFSAQADVIVIRGRPTPLSATIKSEDAKAIVVNEGKKAKDETIPAVDVLEVTTDAATFGTLGLGGGPYKTAQNAEKEADVSEGAKRKTALDTAIKMYDETLKKMKRDTTAQKYAARNLEYRIAMLTLKQAADQVGTDRAVKRLQEFKTNFPNSWQVNIVIPLIAQIQVDNKEYAEAAKTWQEIADLDIFPASVRLDAELKVVEMAVREGKVEVANKKLDAIDRKVGKNPVFASRVKMARAEVFIGFKQPDKAFPLFQEVVKETNDKQIKALAHNALGEFYFKASPPKYNEALWEFLWVDAVFNQDKAQHAKALYYLWKTFEQLNSAERAQECRDLLLSQPFAGTEYQKLAQQK